MDYFNRLLNLLLSPLGVFAVSVCVVWLVLALRSSAMRWVGVGGAMYAASLAKYFDPFELEEWYPLWGPFEALVDNGRPLAIVCLAVLVVLSLSVSGGPSGFKMSPLMMPIHAIQLLIFVKLLGWGSDTVHTIQAGIIFFLIYMIAVTGLRNWVFSETTLRGPAIALTTAGALFCFVVLWQSRMDTAPIFIGGRMMGTTANPQHAAVFLALALLGPCYLVIDRWSSPLFRLVLMGEMLVHCNFLLETGSRTGLAMAAIIFFLFFRRRVSSLYAIGLAVVGVVIFGMKEIGERFTDFSSRGDTRTVVWRSQLENFYENPVFGRNDMGARFTIGENSWLGLMEATGVFGLVVLVWLLSVILRTISRLSRVSQHKGIALVDVDFCLAGLVGVMAGSFLEAYLVGIITMPVLFLAMLSVCCEKVTTPLVPSEYSYLGRQATAG